MGWAFPEIPAPAIEWVHSQAEGKGATNIWAPFLMPYQGIYRLYYCVSAFGRNTSYIGMAESDSPEGPWIQKGCVVKTGEGDAMNAIDPSVIEDPETGKWWAVVRGRFHRAEQPASPGKTDLPWSVSGRKTGGRLLYFRIRWIRLHGQSFGG